MLKEVPDVNSSGSERCGVERSVGDEICPGLNVSKNECVIDENCQSLNVLNVEVARV